MSVSILTIIRKLAVDTEPVAKALFGVRLISPFLAERGRRSRWWRGRERQMDIWSSGGRRRRRTREGEGTTFWRENGVCLNGIGKLKVLHEWIALNASVSHGQSLGSDQWSVGKRAGG